MKQTRHHLAEVIAERTLHVHDENKLAREVAAYLIDQHLTASIDSLVRDILQYRADHGVVEVTAVSAHDLDTVVINDIKAMLRTTYPDATSVTVNQKIDQEVVGGVRVDFANEILDITTQTQLNRFKRLTGAEKGIV